MKIACPNCREIFDTEEVKCTNCSDVRQIAVLKEERLLEEAKAVSEEGDSMGLRNLAHAIDSITIQIAQGRMTKMVKELQSLTPLTPTARYQDDDFLSCVMSSSYPPRFILREARRDLENPFSQFNFGERTSGDTNTRLETFTFEVSDIENLYEIQKSRGVTFLTSGILDFRNYRYIQTTPSRFSGNSVGYIEWKSQNRSFGGDSSEVASINEDKRSRDYIQSMDYLDHTATRVRANDRIDAIKEWLTLLPYFFHLSIYVKPLNSITNVTRMAGEDFAMVFTTGITPYRGLPAGIEPTERFIVDYGTRVHHMAWNTSKIERVAESLKTEGQEFLLDLVGSEKEGLKQTFTAPSDLSMLVTEYIHRYPGFDGLFTRSNVTELTRATGLQ